MRKSIISLLTMGAMILAGCHGHSHEGHSHDAHAEHEGHIHAEQKKSEGEEHLHAGEVHFTHEQAEAAGLQLETVQPAPFSLVLRASGELQAQQGNEQTIVATTSGVVHYANASIVEGTAVRQGERLATISANTLQEGDPVQKLKLAYEAAEREFRRAERLIADKIISQKEYNQARLQYETAKAAYEGQAQNHSDRGTAVGIPLAGYIKSLLVAQGEYVGVGQPIAVVTQSRRLQLRADVSERDYRHLRDIQSANFRTAYDDKVYCLADLNGRLLSYGKTTAAGSSYIPVTFEFDNVGDFLPGAFAEVFLLSAPKDSALSIPVSALTEEQGLMFVYLHFTEDIYKKQEVTLGQSDGTRVEVLHGLKAGDRVVTRGAYQVKLASASTAIPAHSHNH